MNYNENKPLKDRDMSVSYWAYCMHRIRRWTLSEQASLFTVNRYNTVLFFEYMNQYIYHLAITVHSIFQHSETKFHLLPHYCWEILTWNISILKLEILTWDIENIFSSVWECVRNMWALLSSHIPHSQQTLALPIYILRMLRLLASWKRH